MDIVRGGARQSIVRTAQRLMARKGYTAVGVAEIVAQAGVPKGSFYHYFASKDALGEVVMKDYFAKYLSDMDLIIGNLGATAAERLVTYWQYWYDNETSDEVITKCLAVKLGAEVADMSEPMRRALEEGTSAVISRISGLIEAGATDRSLALTGDALALARFFYDLWLGASVRAKIDQDASALDNAMARCRDLIAG